MEHEEENHEMPKQSSRNKTTIILIGAVVALLGGVLYFYLQNESLKQEQQRQEKEISDTYLKLDSVAAELTLKINKIEELGGEIDTLVALREQLELDKKNLLARGKNQQKNINRLNEKVSGYKELLLLKDEEIEELQRLNEQLAEENTTLKVEKNELSKSIKELEQNKEELVDKVAKASRLEAGDFLVTAISDRGKERTGDFRNRHIEKLRIEFTVGENEIAPIEGKEILVRVVAPDGNVLFDVTRGSGSFTFEGREQFYTAKKEILYDRSNQRVSFEYEKGSEYMLGIHQVEAYTDDYLLGKGSFTVK